MNDTPKQDGRGTEPAQAGSVERPGSVITADELIVLMRAVMEGNKPKVARIKKELDAKIHDAANKN